MRIPLRVRVFGLIAVINVAMFGVGLFFLARKLEDDRRTQYSEALAYALQATINAGDDFGVAQILRWPNWRYFDDAIIVRASFETGPGERGKIVPRGAFLNPVGRAGRRADFGEQSILRDLADVVRTRRAEERDGGVVLPILDPSGGVWGGCWFRLTRDDRTTQLALSLLPWFLLSTLLFSIGTFTVLQRFVLDPVHTLASGAQRVSAGDLSVRLPEPARRDEMADLIAGFNAMTARVQGFNAELAREVEAATEQVRRAEAAAMTQRRLAATGELAAGIAHEINNPLGGLLNAVETLQRPNLPPEKHARYVALLRNGLERIQATVGQLLRFTPRTTKPAPVALAQPVEDAIALVQHRALGQGVSIAIASGDLEAEVEPERRSVIERWHALPPVLGEQNELAQAVLNLLVNALDALESALPAAPVTRGGRILVRLDRRGDEIELAVADDGPGVPAQELPRIVDLFYTTKEVGKGTGLGLAIVHNVVASHGGRIDIASASGAGFRVTIKLPVWAPDPGGAGGIATP